MTSNSLKARLASGKKCYGVWTAGFSTVYTETLAASGYDFIFLDQEHGPQGLMETIPHLQTLAAYPAHRWCGCRGTTRSI